VRRLLGTALILGGCLVLIVQVPRLEDVVVFSLRRGRGVHLSDVFGLAIVIAGVAMLWRER
jgi:hypothetical protein